MRRCSYRQFKSGWQQWQQVLNAYCQSDETAPVVGVVWGDSEYLMGKVSLRTKQLVEGHQGLVVRVDGDAMAPQDWQSLLVEPGLLPQKKLYIIHSAQQLDLKLFVSVAAGATTAVQRTPRASRTTSPVAPLNMLAGGVHAMLFCVKTSNARPPKGFFKILPPRHYQIMTCELKSYQLSEFSADMAMTLGVKLTPQADYLLRLSCGDRPYFLEQTLKKIVLIHPDIELIDHLLIQQYLDLIPASGVFKIYAYLATAQEAKAQLMIQELINYQKMHPLAVLGALHYYVKQIAALMTAAGRAGGNGGGVQSSPGFKPTVVPAFLKKEYAMALKGVTTEKLARVLVLIAVADVHYKTHIKLAVSHSVLHELVTAIISFCYSK